MNRTEEIINILESFIEPKCELVFHNNYELLVSVVLSAQTTDKHVNLINQKLFNKCKNIYELNNADKKDIEEIIKPLGLSKVKSGNLKNMANVIVNNYQGNIPNDFNELIKLPGVGRKTAQVVLALGFNIPSLPVDTHVTRVSKMLGIVNKESSVLEIEETLKKQLKKEMWIDAHHLLLLFGRYYCKAKNPECNNCKLIKYCKKQNY